MFLSNNRLKYLRSSWLIMIFSLSVAACGGDESRTVAEVKDDVASDEAPTEQAWQGTEEESTTGSMAFTVEGDEKSFDYLPKSGGYYTKMASNIRAYREAGATETLFITFMSFDLKKLNYPTQLPLPKDMTKPIDIMAAMASVGFGYINTEGVEWAGPGKVQVESFSKDGVVRGTFDQVSLPHTDSDLPNITLTNGSFTARITSPW